MSHEAPQEPAAPQASSSADPGIESVDDVPGSPKGTDGGLEEPQGAVDAGEGLHETSEESRSESEGSSNKTKETEGDHISIPDSDLADFAGGKSWDPNAYTRRHMEDFRKDGGKYARVTGLYVEGLEARVSALEAEVNELKRNVNPRKNEEKPFSSRLTDPDKVQPSSSAEEQSSPVPVNDPCSLDPPSKIKKLSVEDLNNTPWSTKRKEACVYLALATDTELPQHILPPLPTQHNSRELYPTNTSEARGLSGGTVQGLRPSLRPSMTTLTRFLCTSPWLIIIIELVSGEMLRDLDWQWIYPFKHLVFYHEEIRMYVKLLSEIEPETLNIKDMIPTLRRISQEVVYRLGPRRTEIDYSDNYVERAIDRWDETHFQEHFRKSKQSSLGPAKTTSEHRQNSEAPISQPDASRENDPSNEQNKPHDTKSTVAGEQAISDQKCTCLKDARDHLQLVVDVLDEHLIHLQTLQKSISDHSLKKIFFQDLWFLYQPGDIVVTCRPPRQAYCVLHLQGGRSAISTAVISRGDTPLPGQEQTRTSGKKSPFKIECARLDFDGDTFGPVPEYISILPFEDERKITELDVYPIKFDENEEMCRNALVKRGQHFASYREFKHKKYAGMSLDSLEEEVESEVIVDFAQAFRQPEYSRHKPELGLVRGPGPDPRETYEDFCQTPKCNQLKDNILHDDTSFDDLRTLNFLDHDTRNMLLEDRPDSQPLTDDHFILMPFRVHGFSLRSRNWVSLNIESISDVPETDALDSKLTGFDDLVIPDEYKKVVKALVKTHALGSGDANSHQFDLVRGKGKGLIILLHGVPGVGKTSTAESVAAYTRRPLFPITCGDIGQTARTVESNLESIFLLARKWGCVLLLDEADVFLEKRERSGSSLQRNALVSVFLRTLEYYSGILFLTTNRIGSFDEAFVSRIHMSLYYPDLDQQSTLKVWVMNMNRIKRSGRNIYVNEEEITTFAKDHWRDGHRWNGRQIRNAFQTALALAEYDFQEKCIMCEQIGEKPPLKPALQAKHFKAVAQTTAEFDNYLKGVFGGSTHKEKAQLAEVRNDAWEDRGMETPSGKKYSVARATRANGSLIAGNDTRKIGQVAVAKSPEPREVKAADVEEKSQDAKAVDEDEEFRQYLEKKRKEEEEEKIKRFERRAQEMQMRGK